MKFLTKFFDCVYMSKAYKSNHLHGRFILLGYVLLSKCSRVITRSHPAQIVYHYLLVQLRQSTSEINAQKRSQHAQPVASVVDK
jgi:hypothetical protein